MVPQATSRIRQFQEGPGRFSLRPLLPASCPPTRPAHHVRLADFFAHVKPFGVLSDPALICFLRRLTARGPFEPVLRVCRSLLLTLHLAQDCACGNCCCPPCGPVGVCCSHAASCNSAPSRIDPPCPLGSGWFAASSSHAALAQQPFRFIMFCRVGSDRKHSIQPASSS